MPAYLLKPIEAPWGDYGHFLYHGMSMHQSRTNGRIRLERTGPEIFPITFPVDVIVTEQFRKSFASSDLKGAQFQMVIKHHIVEFDWESWDVTEDEAPLIPDSGKPEDYVLAHPHSAATAAAMPQLWELIASNNSSDDIFYLPKTKVVALSPKAKTWFENNYGDYVSIVEKN